MHLHAFQRASCALAAVWLVGCTSPLDRSNELRAPGGAAPPDGRATPPSAYRAAEHDAKGSSDGGPALIEGAGPDAYVTYALYHSPEVEAAYQRWRAATERLPQVRALPDPRLNVGFFLNEVETRVGPQQARVGVQQTFPWPGKLDDREDAAAWAARAAWWRFEATRLAVTQRVAEALYELAYLDAAIRITRDNLDLLGSFEEVARARYRVGAGSHPSVIRTQVELGQVEDRLAQLNALRPAYVTDLNAALNRPSSSALPPLNPLPDRLADGPPDALASMARQNNPALRALEEQVEQERRLGEVARKDGLPDLTIGLDYIVTGEAMDSSIPESGDDPILLSFGVNVPLWRDKYEAGVRESLARRLSVAHDRAGQANTIEAQVHRAWFEHTDAHRRVRLYESTLIPKAEESLQASLTSFQNGDSSYFDLLDTERTLLEFAVSAERARADRGRALARLNTLVGGSLPTRPATGAGSDQDPEGGARE